MMVARGRNPDSTRAGTGFRGPKPRESGPGQGGSRGPKPRQFRQFGGQNPVSWPHEGHNHAPGPMSAANPPAGHRAGETSLLPHFFCRGPKPRLRQHRPAANSRAVENRSATGRFGVSAPGRRGEARPPHHGPDCGSPAGIHGSRRGQRAAALIPLPSEAEHTGSRAFQMQRRLRGPKPRFSWGPKPR